MRMDAVKDAWQIAGAGRLGCVSGLYAGFAVAALSPCSMLNALVALLQDVRGASCWTGILMMGFHPIVAQCLHRVVMAFLYTTLC